MEAGTLATDKGHDTSQLLNRADPQGVADEERERLTGGQER